MTAQAEWPPPQRNPDEAADDLWQLSAMHELLATREQLQTITNKGER